MKINWELKFAEIDSKQIKHMTSTKKHQFLEFLIYNDCHCCIHYYVFSSSIFVVFIVAGINECGIHKQF